MNPTLEKTESEAQVEHLTIKFTQTHPHNTQSPPQVLAGVIPIADAAANGWHSSTTHMRIFILIYFVVIKSHPPSAVQALTHGLAEYCTRCSKNGENFIMLYAPSDTGTQNSHFFFFLSSLL